MRKSSGTSKRYSSSEYVYDYKAKGIFPRIHNDIFNMVKENVKGKRAIDLGSCTGLISIRLVEQAGFEFVAGLEGNISYLEKAIPNDKVTYFNFYVTKENMDKLKEVIVKNGITVVVGRRVIPEIGERDISVVYDLVKLLYEVGVEEIVLEGRVVVKKPTNKLYSIEKEIECFDKYFKLVAKNKECAYLVRR